MSIDDQPIIYTAQSSSHQLSYINASQTAQVHSVSTATSSYYVKWQ